MSAVIQRQDQLPGMPEPANLLEAITRAAADPNVDVAKMDRLMDIYARIQGMQAEAAFNDAMSAAQGEMGPISQDANNPQTRSKYASYNALDRALRPIYTKHGFAISYDTGESTKPSHVLVLAYVSRGGYTRTYRLDMPADGKGAKGGDVMTLTHATMAGVSYGKRGLLKAIFNVAEGEGDMDGNAPADAKTVNEEQVANLEALLTEVGANKSAFLKWAKVGSLSQILAKNYTACVKAIEAKRK